jgi:drug/metabolite transporter (DMT)-like permease
MARSTVPAKQNHNMKRITAQACLALSMALVGVYVALSKPMAAALPVLLLLWLRFGLGALAMLHWLPRPTSEPPLQAQSRRLIFLASFLGNFLFSLCMLFGVSLSSAVAAGVIMAAIPAVVALLSRVFLKEQLSARVGVAVALGVAGVALFAWAPNSPGTIQTGRQTGHEWLGHLLLVGAVLCEAAYAVIGKRLTASVSPRRITALINLWGLALMTPLGLWAAWGFDFGAVPLATWGLLVFYAMAASVWTVWLWMTGLQGVPASEAGVFTVMLPVSAALVGVLFLGERMDGLQLAALGLALAGVLLATLPQRRA